MSPKLTRVGEEEAGRRRLETGAAGLAAANGEPLAAATSQPLAAASGEPMAAACRASSLATLAILFREPDAELVDALSSGELLGGLAPALAGREWDRGRVEIGLRRLALAADEAQAGDPAAVLEDLSVEYARLFTGPGLTMVPAHASEYLEPPTQSGRGLVGGDVAAAVEATYRSFGVAVAGSADEPDFLPVELEFLYLLERRVALSLATEDAAAADDWRAAAEQFTGGHMALWMPQLARRLLDAHPCQLYAGAADLLAAAFGEAAPCA